MITVKSEVVEAPNCYTGASRGARARATASTTKRRQAHHSLLLRCLGWRKRKARRPKPEPTPMRSSKHRFREHPGNGEQRANIAGEVPLHVCIVRVFNYKQKHEITAVRSRTSSKVIFATIWERSARRKERLWGSWSRVRAAPRGKENGLDGAPEEHTRRTDHDLSVDHLDPNLPF